MSLAEIFPESPEPIHSAAIVNLDAYRDSLRQLTMPNLPQTPAYNNDPELVRWVLNQINPNTPSKSPEECRTDWLNFQLGRTVLDTWE